MTAALNNLFTNLLGQAIGTLSRFGGRGFGYRYAVRISINGATR